MAVSKSARLSWLNQIVFVLCFYCQGISYPTPSSFILEEKESHIVDSSDEAKWIGYIGYDFDIDSYGTPCFVYYTTNDELRLLRGIGGTVENLAVFQSAFYGIQGGVPLGGARNCYALMDLNTISAHQGWEMGTYWYVPWQPYTRTFTIIWGGMPPLSSGCSIAAGPSDGDLAILAKVRWWWPTNFYSPELRTWFRTLRPSWGHANLGPANYLTFDPNEPDSFLGISAKGTWIGGFQGAYPKSRSIAFAPDGSGRIGGIFADVFYNTCDANPRIRYGNYWEGEWGCIGKKSQIGIASEIWLPNSFYPEPCQTKMVMGYNDTTILAIMYTYSNNTSIQLLKKSSIEYICIDGGTGWYHMDLCMQDHNLADPASVWFAATNPNRTILLGTGAGATMRTLDMTGGWSVGITTGPHNEPYVALVDNSGKACLYYFIGNRDGNSSNWLSKSLKCKFLLDFISPCWLNNYFKGADTIGWAGSQGSRTAPVLVKCKKDASGKTKLHFMWYGSDGYLHYARGRMQWW